MTYTLDDLDGADLRLPVVRPARLNPNYERVRSDYLEWLTSARALSPEIGPIADRLDMLRLASSWWPDAPAETLIDVAILVAISIFRDDAVDAEDYRRVPTIVPAALADCRSHHTTAKDPVCGPLFADVWTRIDRYTPPAVMQRLLAREEELLEAYLESHARHTQNRGFTDLDDFFRLRSVTFGCPITHTFTELVYRSDYTGLIDHPETQELLRCDAERFLLYDGLSSIRKEIAQGNAGDNVLTVIADLQGISLRQAVETLRTMWDDTVVRHRELGHRLLNGPLGSHPHAAELVGYLDDVIAGSIAFIAPSPRYRSGASNERG